ncbi:MAG: hypothetical protein Q8R37_04795 [Nanoarchaeota archaeon]|nr:hypothetical protein [Nanoarchaeota archaeon]
MKRIALRLAILPIVGFSFATCFRDLQKPALEETLRENYGCIGIGHVDDSNPQQREKESLKAALINYSLNCYDSINDSNPFWEEIYEDSTGTAYFYNLNGIKQK